MRCIRRFAMASSIDFKDLGPSGKTFSLRNQSKFAGFQKKTLGLIFSRLSCINAF